MRSKFRLTQTLVSAFEWTFKKNSGYEDFLRTLNREKTPPTTAMLNGIKYENVLNSVLNGELITPDHEWYMSISEMASELWGSQQQVTLFRDITVDGVDFLIHGVLDYLKAGRIYDCKFSEGYCKLNHITKYMNSPQTSFYLYLAPEAMDMRFLISDGPYVYRETYTRDMVEPPEIIIRRFMNFLERYNLVDIYAEHWRVNN